ncbi:hypothetical protein [Streptomyces sp. NPDC002265]|uniref:hypothetical protein n=1 Tax=Streptomyces sp. NPDC002265 TaxID=3154415 RepID=UPI003330589C
MRSSSCTAPLAYQRGHRWAPLTTRPRRGPRALQAGGCVIATTCQIVTGFKATCARKLTPGQKQANRVLAAGRAPVEHGFANLDGAP